MVKFDHDHLSEYRIFEVEIVEISVDFDHRGDHLMIKMALLLWSCSKWSS
jgi:hypothetical protein